MKQDLTKIVEDLKTNLDQYLKDAIQNAQDGVLVEDNEWILQIKDIYDAAYGEDLDVAEVNIDIPV